MRQEGKLNPEQFALAMYLVQQKQAGKDPPAALTPDMVPPSMRPKGGAATSSDGNRSVYNNPELEAMAKEIQELMQEKMMLEREVQDQEYNIQARGTESHSLQVQFNHTLGTQRRIQGGGHWGSAPPRSVKSMVLSFFLAPMDAEPP